MNPIFITGRFCSGTTFLWNFFNYAEHYCAYYEPLHPGLLASIQHVSPKKGHKGVEDYWQAYRSITDLSLHHAPEFGFERLALKETESHASLESYLYHLIQFDTQKRVAIKFNRVDFRLGWIKQRFPAAKIIHIERNIRDSWKSSRAHLPEEVAKDMFQFNAYELIQWAVSLDEYFPFILDNSTSSYHLHYFFAKLSEKFSHYYADITINFEQDIVENFENFIEKIAFITQSDKNIISAYAQKKATPEARRYDEEEMMWLENVEKECDAILDALNISHMTPEMLLEKQSLMLYPEKRQKIMGHLLTDHYQLANRQIALQGQLNTELEKFCPSRKFASLKKKLSM